MPAAARPAPAAAAARGALTAAAAPAAEPNRSRPAAASPPGQSRRAAARRGQGTLQERQLPASRQLANEAKTGKFGVEAQADELIAQIALAEQGGALSLYEAALAALRTGDNARRVLS